MGCVNVLFNIEDFKERENEIKIFHQMFGNDPDNNSEQVQYYRHNLFENHIDSTEESNDLNVSRDFSLAHVKEEHQTRNFSDGCKIHCAVLVLNANCDLNDDEKPFQKKIFSYLSNNPGVRFDIKIPIVVLCISPAEEHPNIQDLVSTDQTLRLTNRFIHFMFGVDKEQSYRRCMARIASIGIVLSSNFDLLNLKKERATYFDFVCEKILFEKYQSNLGIEKHKNIAHLIAKMDVAWAVNRLCDVFPSRYIYRLFKEKDTYSLQNPLMIAAINTKKAVLASFMNFYSSNIDMTERHFDFELNLERKCDFEDNIREDCKPVTNVMTKCNESECKICIVRHLLHDTDSRNKNLTYYILTADEKCLGPYGTVLQFEEDFHIRKRDNNKIIHKGNDDQKKIEDKEDLDFLRLQACIQKHVGSSLEANQVLDIFQQTRKPTKISIILSVAYALLGLYLFQMGLYLMDVITDSLVAKGYYQEWKFPNTSSKTCMWSSPLSRYIIVSGNKTFDVSDLTEYPDCLSHMWKFLYTTGFMLLPTLFYLIEMLRHYKKIFAPKKITNEDCTKTEAYLLCGHNVRIEFLVPIGIVVFPLLTPFWPLILFVWKSYPLAKFHWKSGPEKRKYLEQFERISLIVLVVHLIEACIESSFMAILQWYTVMPQMLHEFHGYLIDNQYENPSFLLSKISFIFSILSLAWGFTTYSAEQKDGALDLTWNPAGRILLFVSNLCLIFARINSLVLFMYFWGPGEFKPGMFWLLIHVLVMMLVHYYTLYYRIKEYDSPNKTDDSNNRNMSDQNPDFENLKKNEHENTENEESIANERIITSNQDKKESNHGVLYYLTVLYVCLVNGLANIFINNFVNISLNRFKHIGTKKKKTFHRQICGDLLFLLQNIVMVGFGLTTNVKPIDNPITSASVAGVIFGCHFLGLLIKIIYYKYFHIWKDLTPRITNHGIKRGLEKSELKKLKNDFRKKSKKLLRSDISQHMV